MPNRYPVVVVGVSTEGARVALNCQENGPTNICVGKSHHSYGSSSKSREEKQQIDERLDHPFDLSANEKSDEPWKNSIVFSKSFIQQKISLDDFSNDVGKVLNQIQLMQVRAGLKSTYRNRNSSINVA